MTKEKPRRPGFDRTPFFIPDRDRYREQYGVIVVCDDEAHQERVYDELRARGHECRVVVT